MSAEKLNGTAYEAGVNSVVLLDAFTGEGVDGLWGKAPNDKTGNYSESYTSLKTTTAEKNFTSARCQKNMILGNLRWGDPLSQGEA